MYKKILSLTLFPLGIASTALLPVSSAQAVTVASDWIGAATQGVRNQPQGPTVASRLYGILGTAMYDAWSAYEATPISTVLGDTLQRPTSENTQANKQEAISFAAYRVLTELLPTQTANLTARMNSLGYDPNNTSTDTTTAAGIGNTIAATLMNARRNDGSNQLNNYVDTIGYSTPNTPTQVVDIELWTPESVPIDSGSPLQKYLTPHWGTVESFSLTDNAQYRPPEIIPPFLLDSNASADLQAGTITRADGTVVPISAALVGVDINPAFIQQAVDVVAFSANLTDEQKLIAEFWEDGPGTPFPPGTWMEFGQDISQRDNNTLDEDVQLFFALGNAVMDAGIATWEAKLSYNSARPVRVIRELGRLGLIGTDNNGDGVFEINAWGGPGLGTITIPATQFLTYQNPFGPPSPPFAEYTSGHSAFSAAGAEILRLFTGSDVFGGSVTFAPGTSAFEPGITPSSPVTLSWDTFSEAADEAGISRRYGGIHFLDGDIQGRILGRRVGGSVWNRSQFFINGGVTTPEADNVLALLTLVGIFSLTRLRKSKIK
ncbi:vanadium-dependent haloperoxidase [Microcystis sp. LEGE 08355]|uniref:vanadium-dependent haloperoxidase n=1 Tax=Microcystis sp. LEGE 08355 TaxID=1828687 RepID=UPI00188158FA|nr:vanadium-dependent haloperoxidase [Microcystis sp. LEGE 08355]MBE9071968.1 vanadium-dependent haloperoxidase [Microcystis sp. LEGE 08355]